MTSRCSQSSRTDTISRLSSSRFEKRPGTSCCLKPEPSSALSEACVLEETLDLGCSRILFSKDLERYQSGCTKVKMNVSCLPSWHFGEPRHVDLATVFMAQKNKSRLLVLCLLFDRFMSTFHFPRFIGDRMSFSRMSFSHFFLRKPVALTAQPELPPAEPVVRMNRVDYAMSPRICERKMNSVL